MNNLTQAAESLSKSTAQRPRILVRYLGGYGIKRLILREGTQFAHIDAINLSAARALMKKGVPLHAETEWVW